MEKSQMRAIKKIFKVILIMILVLTAVVAAADLWLIYKPELDAKRKIDGIEEAARRIEDLTVNENAKIIGLGEATHGNADFQALKLDVLKTLIENYGVNCFAMEMDYGEGVIINDYIRGCSDLTIDEVMDHISFRIYKTHEIRNLIEWMKEYNDSHENKLAFYGFDFQNPDVDLCLIVEFMKKNSVGDASALEEVFDSFLNGETRFKDDSLSEGFNQLRSLKEELESGHEEYQDLLNYDRILGCIDSVLHARELTIRYAGENGSVEGGQYRDQMMAERVFELSEAGDVSKIMIAGHNGHIGYAGNYVKSMGSFLREKLGEAYFSIGTDYFISNSNMPNNNGRRSVHRFVSGDILAYQAKDLGTYYLFFSEIDEGSPVYRYIHEPIYTGSLGEGYSILNTVLQDTVRIYCEPEYLYDAMILVYECAPLNLLESEK